MPNSTTECGNPAIFLQRFFRILETLSTYFLQKFMFSNKKKKINKIPDIEPVLLNTNTIIGTPVYRNALSSNRQNPSFRVIFEFHPQRAHE